MLNAIVTSSKTNCCKISLLYAPAYTQRSIQAREHNSLDLVFNLILSLSRSRALILCSLYLSLLLDATCFLTTYHASPSAFTTNSFISHSRHCFRDAFVRRCWG